MTLPEIVRVSWLDTESHAGWRKVDGLPSLDPVHSIGFVLRETAELLTITHSISDNGQFLDAVTIPKAAITNLERGEFLPRPLDYTVKLKFGSGA